VGLDVVCQTAKLIGCAVNPICFVGTADELCMFIGITGVSIDDGESGVKVGSCV
jgi:hypothetical protein